MKTLRKKARTWSDAWLGTIIIDQIQEREHLVELWHIDGVYHYDGDAIHIWRDEHGAVHFYNETQGFGGEVDAILEGWVNDRPESPPLCDDGWDSASIVTYVLESQANGKYRYSAARPLEQAA